MSRLSSKQERKKESYVKNLSNHGAIWNVCINFRPNWLINEDFWQKAHLHIRRCLLNGIDPENEDSKFCIKLAQVVSLRLAIVPCIVSSQYRRSESSLKLPKYFLKIRKIDNFPSRQHRIRKVLFLFVFFLSTALFTVFLISQETLILCYCPNDSTGIFIL